LTPAGTQTREILLLTGERLIAEQGFDKVSLRQVNTAAGQRNSSASHYHFGSKEALVTAIYEYRMGRVNARRMGLLAALPPASGPRPVISMIEILIYPVIEEIESSEGGHNYIQFLSQLFNHPMMDLVKMWRGDLGNSVGRVYYELRTALPTIPDEVFSARFGLMWLLAICALASRERISSASASLVGQTVPVLYVCNLLDVLAGLMAAPVSAATHTEIREMCAGAQRSA
jgi:AcrR family transcriptional regulator